jgi:hypothetical protein
MIRRVFPRCSALLLSIGLGACTDGTPALLGPDAPVPQFGKTSTMLAALSGGMNAAAQMVNVGSDSRTRLELWAPDAAYVTSIDLGETQGLADAGQCTVKNNGGDLGQFMVQPAQARSFGLSYDKTAATSSRHSLNVTWVIDGVRHRVRVKGNIDGFPLLTVHATDLGGGTTRYAYSGGAINVERVLNGVKQFDEMFCTSRDVIVVTVTR